MYISSLQSVHCTARSLPGLGHILAILALCLLVTAPSHAEVPAGRESAAGRGPVFADPIVGTWDVIVQLLNCDTGEPVAPPIAALALFNADGTRHETNATSPALRSPAYGNWHRVKKNEYEFAFKFFRFNTTGATIGSTSVRHGLFLAGDTYESEGTAEFYDPAGNLLFIGCSSATATRYQ